MSAGTLYGNLTYIGVTHEETTENHLTPTNNYQSPQTMIQNEPQPWYAEPLRVETPTVAVEELRHMEKRTWTDEVDHLQNETLEAITEEINAGLEEAANACEFWTHKSNGDPEPGDRVELAIAGNNTDMWDRPIRIALHKDPHCADWDN